MEENVDTVRVIDVKLEMIPICCHLRLSLLQEMGERERSYTVIATAQMSDNRLVSIVVDDSATSDDAHQTLP